MKKIIVSTVLMGLGLTAAFAMPPHGDPGFGEKRLERMTEELNLTDTQQAQLKAIFEAQRVKMKDIHDETKRMMDNVLTDDQEAKLEQMRDNRKENFKEKMKDKFADR